MSKLNKKQIEKHISFHEKKIEKLNEKLKSIEYEQKRIGFKYNGRK